RCTRNRAAACARSRNAASPAAARRRRSPVAWAFAKRNAVRRLRRKSAAAPRRSDLWREGPVARYRRGQPPDLIDAVARQTVTAADSRAAAATTVTDLWREGPVNLAAAQPPG